VSASQSVSYAALARRIIRTSLSASGAAWLIACRVADASALLASPVAVCLDRASLIGTIRLPRGSLDRRIELVERCKSTEGGGAGQRQRCDRVRGYSASCGGRV
jgi:hypothetical protein